MLIHENNYAITFAALNKQKTMKKFYLLFLSAIITLGLSAQTTIYTQSFEDTIGYTLSHVFDDGFSDYNKRDSASNFSFVNAISNVNGTFIIGAEDTDAEPLSPADGVVSILIDSISINGFSNLQFTGAIAAPGGSNYDQCTQTNGDSVLIQVSIDGAPFQRLGFFCAPSGSNHPTMYLDANNNKIGDVGEVALTAALADFSFPISGAGSYLQIKVSYRLDSGSEELAFDNFRIISLPASACAAPSGLNATVGLIDATLSWTNGSGNTLSNIEWGIAGFTQGSGTLITAFNQGSGSLMLNNLMMGTSYDFYVQDSCASAQGTVSNWTGPFTFTTNSPINTYDIATVTVNDANFVPDSIGVYCKLIGVVTSIDFDGNAGYNFTIQDSTGGIYIFSFTDINNYQSTQGDELRVVGTIGQFNGLTQLAVDSITVLSTGNALPTPQVVTFLNEATENEYITIEGVYLADPSQWPTSNTSRSIDVVTPMNDTLVMRIDFDTYIFDSILVTGADTFTIFGVGSQFDNSSAPRDAGYQILPSLYTDIVITGTAQCANPFGLGATTTSTSATLTWSNGSGNTFSNIEWGTAGFGQGSGTLITGFNQASGSLMLNNLTTGVTYEFYVQDSCATLGGYSAWVGPFAFTPAAAPTIPTYPIGTIASTNLTTYEPDSLGVFCKIVGVVTSGDFDGNAGYQFTIQDATGGMYLFRTTDIGTYQTALGDELRAVGTISQFNGLTQMNIDSLTLISSGNALPMAQPVTSLGESTENLRITIENARLAASWPTGTSSYNVPIITSTGDTVTLRLDSDFDITDSLTILTTDTFTVIGVGGQFDSSPTPRDAGYQILPSSHTDFTIKPAIVTSCNVPTSLGATPSATEAQLSWVTGGSSMWNIEWGAAGFAQGSGTVIKGITSNPYTLSGLTDQTSYDFYVQDSCASLNSSSAWAGPFNFTTTAPMAIPTYDIATVTTVDAIGEPDSNGVYCKLVGTVFTPDYDGNNGYSFYIQDATGGINIFNFVDLPSGYQSRVGDEIRAVGTILFFNGLIELEVDSITLLSTNNSIGNPTVVTTLDASTVSEFIKMEKVKLVDPSQWPMAGDNANLDIATPFGDTLVMRLDRDVMVQDSMAAAPAGFFDVTGVGGQFDSQAPYFDNYQIFPRRHTDIVDVDPCPAPTGLTAGNISANSADLSWTSTNANAVFNVVWGEAGFTFSSGNVVPGLTSNSFTLTGLDDNKSYEFYVQDSCGSFLGNSIFVGPVAFTTLIDNVDNQTRVSVPLMAFPNPTSQGMVMVNKIGNYIIYDVLGQEVARVINNNRFDATNFVKGIYIVKSDAGETIKVIVK